MPDPTDPSFAIAGGEVVNKGLEVEVTGKLTRNIRVTGGYALIDSEITKEITEDAAVPVVGNRLFNVARHNGSLLMSYAFDSGMFTGLTLGGGVVARSSSYANNENNVRLPGYATLDLFAKYAFEVANTPLEAQLNVNNVFDTTYYPNAATTHGITVGDPLTVFGSLKVTF